MSLSKLDGSAEGSLKSKVLLNYWNWQKVGSGGYGLVIQAIKKGGRGPAFAIKMIPTTSMEFRRKSVEEAKKLSAISKHDSVISCLDYWEDEFTPEEQRAFANHLKLGKGDHFHGVDIDRGGMSSKFLCIRMELCGNGNLRTWLKGRKEFHFNESLQIFLQIARGIEHVHHHKLIHRDLKPANILFNGKIAKISDFGWSVAHQSGDYNHTARAGAALYQAPEQTLGIYGPSVDYYALGLMLYELFCPNAQKDVGKALLPLKFGQTGLGQEVNLKEHPVVAVLIRRLISFEPKERPNCEMIICELKLKKVLDMTKDNSRAVIRGVGTHMDELFACGHCLELLTEGNVRYKCLACDLSICEGCEDDGKHPSDHDLVKIKITKVGALEKEDLDGCKHYRRKCKIQCPDADCKKFFVCRCCHDETIKRHTLDRFKIEIIQCSYCGLKQAPRDVCLMCKIEFANYSCTLCNLFDDADDAQEMIFHCDACGICRRRQNAGTKYSHCDNCAMCIPSSALGHECKKDAGREACSVCHLDIHSSRNAAILDDCHHYVHLKCSPQLPFDIVYC